MLVVWLKYCYSMPSAVGIVDTVACDRSASPEPLESKIALEYFFRDRNLTLTTGHTVFGTVCAKGRWVVSEPGINTDLSLIRPSRRADVWPPAWFEAQQRKPRLARTRRIFPRWRPALSVVKETDCTTTEGHPTGRADVDLPLD